MTYPAPTTMYAPHNHGLSFRPYPLTPATQQSLESVNHEVSATTTYQRAFSAMPATRMRPASSTQRSQTDSRGKYASAPIFHQLSVPALSSSLISQAQFSPAVTLRKMLSTQHKTSMHDDPVDVIMIDQATQTDFELDDDVDFHEVIQDNVIPSKLTHFYLPPLPPESEDGSYLRPSTTNSLASSHFRQQQDNILQVPHNRTEALQRFNLMHPDRAPDLRENSVHNGRRHIINGYHAFYWH